MHRTKIFKDEVGLFGRRATSRLSCAGTCGDVQTKTDDILAASPHQPLHTNRTETLCSTPPPPPSILPADRGQFISLSHHQLGKDLPANITFFHHIRYHLSGHHLSGHHPHEANDNIMVEAPTPLRRSRRIQSQSDDESSVASSTHGDSSRPVDASSDVVKTKTPKRRIGQRVFAAARGGDRSREGGGLEAIPENIVDRVGGAAVVSTPAAKKSTRKKGELDSDAMGGVSVITEPVVKVKRTKGKVDVAAAAADDGRSGEDDARVEATSDESKPMKSTGKKDLPLECDVAPATESSTKMMKKKKSRKKSMEAKEVHDAPIDGASTSKSEDEKSSSASKEAPEPQPKASGRDAHDATTPIESNQSGIPIVNQSPTKKTTKRGKSTGVEKVSHVSSNGVSISKSEDKCSTSKDRTKASDETAAALVRKPRKVDNAEGDDKPSKVSKNQLKRIRKSSYVSQVGAENPKSAERTKDGVVESQTEVTKSTRGERSKEKRGRISPTDANDAAEETKNDVVECQTEATKPTRRERSKKKRDRTSSTDVNDAAEETKNDVVEGQTEAKKSTPREKSKKKKRHISSTDVNDASEETKNDVMESQTETTKSTRREKSKKKRSRTSSTDVNDASDGPTPAVPRKVPSKNSMKKNKLVKSSAKGGDEPPSKNGSISLHEVEHSHEHDHPPVSPSPNRLINHLISHEESLSPPWETVKPKLIMDVNVHRLRFMKLHPKSILSMATAPLPRLVANSDHQQLLHPARLAISREGGSVELLSPQDRWVSVGHVPGVRGRDVDAMVWIDGNRGRDDDHDGMGAQESSRIGLVDETMRLFGCSRDGTIFELDFATKRQINVIGSGGGGVFCLASMRSHFAAGCEDGTIKIYSVLGSNGGEYSSGIPTLAATLPSAGNAILSLAWLPGQNGQNDEGMGGSVIFAGVADGTIRRFDCVTSFVTGPISTGSVIASSSGSAAINYRWKSTLRMTVENRGLRESTKVWALKALSDGTVISGDSLGHVQIWDGMSGTMTQTFDHNESGADVLCLAVSGDENKIFASGIDSSVRCIQRQCSSATEEGERKWISSNSHRKHSHDVKALAICHKETSHNSNPLELLVSGSVDARICSYVVKDFKSIRPKIWYNWPTLSPISLSRKKRLLAVTRDNRIDLYFLNGPAVENSAQNMFAESRDESKSLVKTITIQSPFNLSCSVISDDGKFLAASDAVTLYVFSLEVEDKDGILDVRPTKISLGGDCKNPATALKFFKEKLICATISGPIHVLNISAGFSDTGHVCTMSLKHIFKEHMLERCTTSHHFPIVCLDVSSDGKWLAAGRFSSEKGSVHVFSLPNSDGIGHHQHWWAVPQMDASTTCIKFLGGGSVESSLAVGCSNNEFYIYNLGRRSLSHWSNDMGVPLLKSLPKELTSRSEPVTRIVSNSAAPQRFILASAFDMLLL